MTVCAKLLFDGADDLIWSHSQDGRETKQRLQRSASLASFKLADICPPIARSEPDGFLGEPRPCA